MTSRLVGRSSPEAAKQRLVPKTIIPVASGKGGVGKTLLTANLGAALAREGHATIVVDLDFGNSNLHSLLGLPNRFPGIGDYLAGGTGSLEKLSIETSIANLRFIPGDGRMPFLANITHNQKQHLIRDLESLHAHYVLLDLGAGSSFNVIDFFSLSNRGLLVTTPESPSIMSMLVFLKNVAFRLIDQSLRKDPEFVEIRQQIYSQRMTSPRLTVSAVRDKVHSVNPADGAQISRICQNLRPRIIYNMGQNPTDLESLSEIDRSLATTLGLECDHFGYVFHDPSVRESIRERKPLIEYRPNGLAAEAIVRIARRLIRLWDKDIPNSGKLLREETQKVYEEVRKEETAR